MWFNVYVDGSVVDPVMVRADDLSLFLSRCDGGEARIRPALPPSKESILIYDVSRGLIGNNKIAVIKAVREYLPMLTLYQAKSVVDAFMNKTVENLPRPIVFGK